MERLDKFLSNNGAGTRSQVKLLLKQGRVTADGICVKDGSVKIDPDRQRICVDGESLGQAGRVVVMLHKPEGFVTATEDPRDKTVMELLPKQLQHLDLKPVGRLDKATEGLLLFTNDGDLLHRLISPKNEIPKVYYARHEGEATTEDVRAFARGVRLKDGTLCRGALLEPLGPGQSRITVCEGKYHQVRRMMASRNMPVTYLQRQAEGTLQLGQLPVGQVRMLTPEEIGGLGAKQNAGAVVKMPINRCKGRKRTRKKAAEYGSLLGFYLKNEGCFTIKCQNPLAKCAKEVYNDPIYL